MSNSHSPHLHHHFHSLEQQRQASSLGMWVFIAQEIMFFGGLFCGYVVYRNMYPEAFAVASHQLSIGWGGFNTVVLIFSSLTVALAVRSAQLGKKNQIIGWLVATILLGVIFLGVKCIEYSAKWEHHLVPGIHFNYEPHYTDDALHESTGSEHGTDHHPAPAVYPGHVQIFFAFYFAMTGMHALHMIIGIGLMIWIIWLATKDRFAPEYYAPVELFGLYWHFVDVIWIFLFPLLYLIGRHVT
ncbi:MAG: cytochrome c oxidase subunit 3 family protein [Kiritimatiellae bacterium]|nr:cytochrome c oxidase subunit 3 family protein [Kiritimatiellia bacterium]